MNDAVDSHFHDGVHVPVVFGTSALSYEQLCKLNDDNSQKDLQHIDFALLCVIIALLCATFSLLINLGLYTECSYFSRIA